MTSEQYERWRDFAIRAAKTWYANSRRPSAAWVLEMVEDFFESLMPDIIPCIVNWDHSTEYPEGNPSRRRESRLSYCDCDGWRFKHGKPNPDCPECHGSGVHYPWEHPYCTADEVRVFLDSEQGYPPCCRACQGHEGECTCDKIAERYYEQWEDQWGSPVTCCIRAGLDMAGSPSGGVIGFTAGDVRAMYPEGVPEWLFPKEERLVYAMTDVENGTFAELPDEAALWL